MPSIGMTCFRELMVLERISPGVADHRLNECCKSNYPVKWSIHVHASRCVVHWQAWTQQLFIIPRMSFCSSISASHVGLELPSKAACCGTKAREEQWHWQCSRYYSKCTSTLEGLLLAVNMRTKLVVNQLNVGTFIRVQKCTVTSRASTISREG
jgi:hypothetical protein